MATTGVSESSPPGTVKAALSFEEFFRAEYARLVRALMVLTSNRAEAEDIAQEAMTRAYERWRRVSTMELPAGYVYRTGANIHRSRRRRVKVWSRRLREVATPAGDHALGAAARTDLITALQRLPSAQRDALMLTEWYGLTSAEAARVLGVEAASIRSRVHRARLALKAMLEALDD